MKNSVPVHDGPFIRRALVRAFSENAVFCRDDECGIQFRHCPPLPLKLQWRTVRQRPIRASSRRYRGGDRSPHSQKLSIIVRMTRLSQNRTRTFLCALYASLKCRAGLRYQSTTAGLQECRCSLLERSLSRLSLATVTKHSWQIESTVPSGFTR